MPNYQFNKGVFIYSALAWLCAKIKNIIRDKGPKKVAKRG